MGPLGQVSLAAMLLAAQLPGGAGPGPGPGSGFGFARPPEPGRPPGPFFGPGRPPEEFRPVCLSNPDIREAMQARRAVPPYRAVAEAMHEGGDLVAIRLCRAGDPPLVYDVSVLRRDGRLVHIIVDAATGTALPGRRWP